MRASLIKQLTIMALQNPKIQVILPDIGVFAFKQAGFPEKQLLNTGLCEQLSVDLAAGMCIKGMIPFVYTIAPFVVERAYEQIKMACYNELPIKIVGVGAGLTYSQEGPTHHSCNDIALMRTLPNMTVYSPCSNQETALITEQMVNNCKPSYIRLTTKPSDKYDWKMEEYHTVTCVHYSISSKIAILTTGGIINNVLEAIKVVPWEYNQLYSVYSISDFDPHVLSYGGNGPDLLAILRTHSKVVTIEEHTDKGLGALIAEIIAYMGINTTLRSIAVPNEFCTVYGTHDELLDWAGLSVAKIKEKLDCIAKL